MRISSNQPVQNLFINKGVTTNESPKITHDDQRNAPNNCPQLTIIKTDKIGLQGWSPLAKLALATAVIAKATTLGYLAYTYSTNSEVPTLPVKPGKIDLVVIPQLASTKLDDPVIHNISNTEPIVDQLLPNVIAATVVSLAIAVFGYVISNLIKDQGLSQDQPRELTLKKIPKKDIKQPTEASSKAPCTNTEREITQSKSKAEVKASDLRNRNKAFEEYEAFEEFSLAKAKVNKELDELYTQRMTEYAMLEESSFFDVKLAQRKTEPITNKIESLNKQIEDLNEKMTELRPINQEFKDPSPIIAELEEELKQVEKELSFKEKTFNELNEKKSESLNWASLLEQNQINKGLPVEVTEFKKKIQTNDSELDKIDAEVNVLYNKKMKLKKELNYLNQQKTQQEFYQEWQDRKKIKQQAELDKTQRDLEEERLVQFEANKKSQTPPAPDSGNALAVI